MLSWFSHMHCSPEISTVFLQMLHLRTDAVVPVSPHQLASLSSARTDGYLDYILHCVQKAFFVQCSMRFGSQMSLTRKKIHVGMCACMCEIHREGMCQSLPISRNRVCCVKPALCSKGLEASGRGLQ